MQSTEVFTYEKTYHIYNRGINSCNIFLEEENYRYFLKLYDKYVFPIADTLVWVLMPNHFHFLIRVKEKEAITNPTPDRVANPVRGKLRIPSQQFSNFFNAYAQAYNKRYNRHGALFERRFKRKLINDDKYLKTIILYIHNNPVHHGFTDHPSDYYWNSYNSIITKKPTKIKRQEVLELFENIENFKFLHQQKVQIDRIEKYLGLEE